jgi:hypothetical protein
MIEEFLQFCNFKALLSCITTNRNKSLHKLVHLQEEHLIWYAKVHYKGCGRNVRFILDAYTCIPTSYHFILEKSEIYSIVFHVDYIRVKVKQLRHSG